MKSTKADIIVLGSGVGGYTAAFYAAERGRNVILIEQDPRLGGVCLNKGCIPSKALLHATKLMDELEDSASRGVVFGKPQIELNALRVWKDSILTKLSDGVAMMAKKRNVEVMQGRGYFEDSSTLRVETPEGQKFLTFDKAIIAVGSRPSLPPAFDLGNKRVMTSDEALEVEDIPEQLLVVGGGYIGMELGTVYSILGSTVIMAEALDSILTGADADLIRPVKRRAEKLFKEIRLGAKVSKMSTSGKHIKVVMEVAGETKEELFDKVLVSVGRAPNTRDLGLENTGIKRDEKGFIVVDSRQATAEPNIFAIGDVAGGVLLAHKATKEARIAVEVITGESSVFEDIIVPAVVFTDPEVAWCGITESEAREKGLAVEVAKFPWSASGRALTFDRPDGMTKLIIERGTERVLGVGIVGAGAGELISEGVLAIEMGATVKDLAESIHPHPTLSETIMECAETFFGESANYYSRRKAEPTEQE